MRVHKIKERQVRALTYLPHGQSCETWLPAGLWQVQGTCSITGRDGSRQAAIILRRPVPLVQDGTWYVGTAVAPFA